jgi:hypothetical protein
MQILTKLLPYDITQYCILPYLLPSKEELKKVMQNVFISVRADIVGDYGIIMPKYFYQLKDVFAILYGKRQAIYEVENTCGIKFALNNKHILLDVTTFILKQECQILKQRGIWSWPQHNARLRYNIEYMGKVYNYI